VYSPDDRFDVTKAISAKAASRIQGAKGCRDRPPARKIRRRIPR